MKAQEFFELACKVRAAQNTYYKGGRMKGDLIRSKQLESQIDKAIAAVKKDGGFEPDQPTATTDDLNQEEYAEHLRMIDAQELEMLLEGQEGDRE